MINEAGFKRLVIIAYRLPFKFVKNKNGYKAIQNSGGLVSAILSLSEKLKESNSSLESSKIVWAGIAETSAEKLSSKNLENEHFDIVPICINSKINDLYYGGFCNDLVWPLFHYFPSYSVFNTEYYNAYKVANSIFCDEVVKILRPGDFVWIHDYQLMLLPEMIRNKIPNSTIGFFLHIPFPSFEIFRLLPRRWRESIINGILGADLVGFHTNDYTQHFIKSVKRTTGFECHHNVINTKDKLVKADAFPIGIDYDKFHLACLDKKTLKEKLKIKDLLFDQKLIFSVDRLDYSKGLLLRLKGYETFLEMYPEWHSKVVFNMVVVPSRDKIETYMDMKKEIEYSVGRINGKYSSLSWSPIIYQYKSLKFEEMVALYDLSDVGLITPLRDGMNLVAKEYIACQIENKGVLILSEMAGASAELSEALIINPSDTVEIAEAIVTALEMKSEEKHSRVERMQKRISTYNVFTWAYDFFKQTFEVKNQQNKKNVIYINQLVSTEIINDYRKSSQRIFFLDYDGTLVSFAKFPEMATIDKHTLGIIKKLTKDPQNQIVIISGRNREFLEKQFKNIDVTLVAEHGFYIKKQNKEWKSIIKIDAQWKDALIPILEEYVNRCNGTFIEIKTGSIAWHYRNADLDFAQLRLHELRDDLSEIIHHKTDFNIVEGTKVLEVKCGRYDKGQAALSIMKEKSYDFILSAGDDNTDEDLFKILPEHAYSIKIGKSPSFARYNAIHYQSFLKLLEKIAG